jgi:hypothetical protein
VHSAQAHLLPVGAQGAITCIQNRDSTWQPFHLFLTTNTHLMLIDLRQPEEPLLSVLHHLAHPPITVMSLTVHNSSCNVPLQVEGGVASLLAHVCCSMPPRVGDFQQRQCCGLLPHHPFLSCPVYQLSPCRVFPQVCCPVSTRTTVGTVLIL